MIYSTFQKRPHLSRLLLGLVLVLGVVELALAITDSFSGRYDWILGCLLFATILAWTGAAALAGAVSPMGKTAMKYAYGVLVAFPLALVALLAALGFHHLRFDTEPDWFEHYSHYVGLVLWAWMALAGLVGALAPRGIRARAYISLVIAPLLMGIGLMSLLLMTSVDTWVSWPDDSMGFPLAGAYGLVLFLLFRAFLSRLTWINRLRSNLLFIPVVVFTVALVTLALGFVLVAEGVLAATLLGLVILLPFGMVTLQSMRSEQRIERRLHDFGVAVTALSIAMASYWVIMVVAIAGAIFLLGGSPFGVMLLIPVMAAIVVSVPAGYLISEMRHPHRNVLVAAIGPGLLMLMIMSYYWIRASN